ncbi:MAG: TonB-dependent receptor, partial [Bacteroidota bacterium]
RDRSTDVTIQIDTSIIERGGGTIEDNNLNDYAFKWDWEWTPSSKQKIGFGAFGNAFDIRYDFTQNDTITVLNRDDQGLLGGAYLQSQSTLFERLILNTGARLSYFDQTGEVYFEPRLQLQYLLSDRIKLKGATGRFYQFANRILREDINQGSRDFWILSDGNSVPVGESTHYIAGIAYETKDYLFDVEAYYKDLNDITEYSTRFVLNGTGEGVSLDFEENFFNGVGLARGVELLAQKKTGNFNGWLSYTIGEVDYNFEVFGPDDFPAAHDVTHETKLVTTYQLGNWSLGATFVYATGRPYTAPTGAYAVNLLDGEQATHYALSDRNAFRLPDYHRLDVSINYDFHNFLQGEATGGLSFFNVYDRLNVWYKEYEVVEDILLETDVNYLGFTPSLYFTWRLK